MLPSWCGCEGQLALQADVAATLVNSSERVTKHPSGSPLLDSHCQLRIISCHSSPNSSTYVWAMHTCMCCCCCEKWGTSHTCCSAVSHWGHAALIKRSLSKDVVSSLYAKYTFSLLNSKPDCREWYTHAQSGLFLTFPHE